MLFMVVETFRPGRADEIYARLAERGRMLPDGLRYVDSWVQTDLRRCYQLMECDDPALFQSWTDRWTDLIEFEIAAVTRSAEAHRAVSGA